MPNSSELVCYILDNFKISRASEQFGDTVLMRG